MTTTTAPTLVIIRGNSGSGKTTIAKEVRRRYGRGLAAIEQDYLRRVVLREHGSDGMATVAPGFIMATTRAALAAGYHVVLEGILHTGQHGSLLRALIAEHPGLSCTFWMNVSLEETLRRHAGRPELAHVSAQMMRGWFTPLDVLGVPGEQVIDEASDVEHTVSRILHDSGLAEAAALTRARRSARGVRTNNDPRMGYRLCCHPHRPERPGRDQRPVPGATTRTGPLLLVFAAEPVAGAMGPSGAR